MAPVCFQLLLLLDISTHLFFHVFDTCRVYLPLRAPKIAISSQKKNQTTAWPFLVVLFVLHFCLSFIFVFFLMHIFHTRWRLGGQRKATTERQCLELLLLQSPAEDVNQTHTLSQAVRVRGEETNFSDSAQLTPPAPPIHTLSRQEGGAQPQRLLRASPFTKCP